MKVGFNFLKLSKLKMNIIILLYIILFVVRLILIRLSPRICFADLPATGCPFYYRSYMQLVLIFLIPFYLISIIIEYKIYKIKVNKRYKK